MSETWPTYGDTVFGPIVTPAQVRDAARETLRVWTPVYVREIARQYGVELPDVQDWTVRPEYRTLPVSKSPACMVVGLGTTRPPHRKGDGRYLVYWGIEVSLVVHGADWQETEDLASYYAMACVGALVQHPSLGGVAESLRWLSTRYGQVEHTATRTTGAARLTFEVAVDDVVNSFAGPKAVTDPTTTPPTVQSVDVVINQEQP